MWGAVPSSQSSYGQCRKITRGLLPACLETSLHTIYLYYDVLAMISLQYMQALVHVFRWHVLLSSPVWSLSQQGGLRITAAVLPRAHRRMIDTATYALGLKRKCKGHSAALFSLDGDVPHGWHIKTCTFWHGTAWH
jgi:hypothetical protein